MFGPSIDVHSTGRNSLARLFQLQEADGSLQLILVLYFGLEARVLPLNQILYQQEQMGMETIRIDMSDILMNVPL